MHLRRINFNLQQRILTQIMLPECPGLPLYALNPAAP